MENLEKNGEKKRNTQNIEIQHSRGKKETKRKVDKKLGKKEISWTIQNQ